MPIQFREEHDLPQETSESPMLLLGYAVLMQAAKPRIDNPALAINDLISVHSY